MYLLAKPFDLERGRRWPYCDRDQLLFCTVVIGQCDWTVGCNRIDETANSLPFLTTICKFKQISGKKTLFSSTNYFFLLRLCFFFSFATSFFNFYFSFYPCTILLSISYFFKTCALFSICEFLLYFLLDCQVTIKKDYSVVMLFRSHVDLCFPFHFCFTTLFHSTARQYLYLLLNYVIAGNKVRTGRPLNATYQLSISNAAAYLEVRIRKENK